MPTTAPRARRGPGCGAAVRPCPCRRPGAPARRGNRTGGTRSPDGGRGGQRSTPSTGRSSRPRSLSAGSPPPRSTSAFTRWRPSTRTTRRPRPLGPDGHCAPDHPRGQTAELPRLQLRKLAPHSRLPQNMGGIRSRRPSRHPIRRDPGLIVAGGFARRTRRGAGRRSAPGLGRREPRPLERGPAAADDHLGGHSGRSAGAAVRPAAVLPRRPGALVGFIDLVRAQMTYRSTGTIVSDWSIAVVSLLPATARPWPELTLSPAPHRERWRHPTATNGA